MEEDLKGRVGFVMKRREFSWLLYAMNIFHYTVCLYLLIARYLIQKSVNGVGLAVCHEIFCSFLGRFFKSYLYFLSLAD